MLALAALAMLSWTPTSPVASQQSPMITPQVWPTVRPTLPGELPTATVVASPLATPQPYPVSARRYYFPVVIGVLWPSK